MPAAPMSTPWRRPATAGKPRARMPPAPFFMRRKKRPGWLAKRSRPLAATATSTSTRPAGCGGTPSCPRSARAPPRSAACSSAASCSRKPADPPMTAVADQTRQDLAFLIAQGTLDGFNRHYRLFRETSRYARSLFEGGQWAEIQRISRERIQFYERRVTETVEYLQRRFGTDGLPDAIWQQVKLHYVGLLTNHRQPELAESFFNSVSCRILHRSYYHNDFLFVRPALSTEHIDSDPPTYRSYYPARDGLRPTLTRILRDFGLRNPFRDLQRDLRWLLRALREHLPRPLKLEANHQIQ